MEKIRIKLIKSKKTSEPFGGFINKKPILIDKNKMGLVNLYEVWEGNLIEKEKIFIFHPVRKVENEIKINFYTESVEVKLIDPFGGVERKVSIYSADDDDIEKVKDWNLSAEDVDKIQSFFISLAEKKAKERNKREAISKMALEEYIHNEYTLDIQESNGRGVAFLKKNNSAIEKLEFDCGDFWHEKPEVKKIAEYCYDKYSAVVEYFSFKGIDLGWEKPQSQNELKLVFEVAITQKQPEKVVIEYKDKDQAFYVPEPEYENKKFLEWKEKFQEVEIKTNFGSVIYEPKLIIKNIDSYGLGSVIYQYVKSQLEEGWGTKNDEVHEYKYFVYEKYQLHYTFGVEFSLKEKRLDSSLLEDGLSNEFIKKVKNYFGG